MKSSNFQTDIRILALEINSFTKFNTLSLDSLADLRVYAIYSFGNKLCDRNSQVKIND